MNKTYLIKYFMQLVIPFFLLIGITACGADEKPLNQYMHEIKTRTAKPIEPIPRFVQPAKFTYPENEKRRSPFKPLKATESKDTKAPNINRPKQALESFPLDSLKFVGMIEIGSTRWALMNRPDGLISRVKPGDYMGKDYGQIQQITKDSIRLKETVKVGGKWENRIVNIKLRKPEGSQ